jgi:hypothetical protein
MNVTHIAMTPAAAREKLRAVRASLHRKADAEYQQLEAGYKALASGRALINLTDAIATAPVDAKGRPMLAIGRADRRQVRATFGSQRVNFSSGLTWRRNPAKGLDVSVPLGRPTNEIPWGFSLIPIVPPEVKKHYDLSKCHVLWEVNQWADQIIRATPDHDPYLLRHIGGDLWAVLGEWDLTELERAVMAGRRQ